MTKNSLGFLLVVVLRALTITAAAAAADSEPYVCMPYPGFVCGGGEDKDDTSFTLKLPLVQCNEDLVNFSGRLDWNASLLVNISVHWVEEDSDTDTINISSPNGDNTTALVPNVRPDNGRFVFLSVNFSSGAVDYSNATVQRAFSRLDDSITKSNFFTFDGSALDLYHTYTKAGAYKPISTVCTVDAFNTVQSCLISCGYENYGAVNDSQTTTSQSIEGDNPSPYCDPPPKYIADDGTCSLQDPRNQPKMPQSSSWSKLSFGAGLQSNGLLGLSVVVVATFGLYF